MMSCPIQKKKATAKLRDKIQVVRFDILFLVKRLMIQGARAVAIVPSTTNAQSSGRWDPEGLGSAWAADDVKIITAVASKVRR